MVSAEMSAVKREIEVRYKLPGGVRDLFHVYLNIFEFHFLRLLLNRTNKFCFFHT